MGRPVIRRPHHRRQTHPCRRRDHVLLHQNRRIEHEASPKIAEAVLVRLPMRLLPSEQQKSDNRREELREMQTKPLLVEWLGDLSAPDDELIARHLQALAVITMEGSGIDGFQQVSY
jgi:hypothetical protein